MPIDYSALAIPKPEPNAVLIPLTRGLSCWVSAEDAEFVQRYKWNAALDKRDGRVYACRTDYQSGKTVFLHKELLDAPMTDHIDNNTLNNCRSNLRETNDTLNVANRTLNKDNTSGFKGVLRMPNGRWRAKIGIAGKRVHIGYFATAEDAARAYDAKAVELWGEHAKTNEQLGLLCPTTK
jgi:hypothetical protein